MHSKSPNWEAIGLRERQTGVLISTGDISTYDQACVDALKTYAASLPKKRARILFHGDETNILHEMLIVAPALTIWPPLLNARPPQSWLMVEGQMAFVRYEPPGTILDTKLLCAKGERGASFLRFSEPSWYTTVPLSEQTVYFETKPGPHVETEFADWGPQSHDDPNAADLLARLARISGQISG